ncbi:reverse transcriptase domain, reverse transcriptase zinc-binding domain protein [Tanacetum coccineum]
MDLNEALRKPSNGLDGRAENKNAESNIRPIDDPAGHNKWRKNISYPDGFVFGVKAHDMSDKLCKCNTDGAREVNGVTEKDYNEKVEDHLVGSINRTRKKRKIVVEDTFAWGKTNEDDLEKNSSGSRRRSNHHAKKVTRRRRSGSGPCNGGTSYEYKSQQVSDSSSGVNVVNENNHSSGDIVCSFKSMREIGEQIGVVWDKGENRSQKDNNRVSNGRDLRGSTNFGFAQSNAIGRSGGLLLIWDSNVFSNVSVVGEERFIAAKGNWKGVDGDVMLVNVYGAHVTDHKMALLNTEFNARDADNFNEFIRLNSLVEIQLGGRKYTRISDDGLKFSKLDQFLVTPEFSTKWDNLSAIALDRKISDHCPILMKDMDLDYGPNPFRVFDLWLKVDFEKAYDSIEWGYLIEIMERMGFGVKWWLKINLNKSKIYSVGVERGELDTMAHFMRCSVGEVPFTYLGLPVRVNMRRVSAWNEVIERFKSRLSEWKAKAMVGVEGRSRLKGGGVWSDIVRVGKELKNMEGGFLGQFIRVIGDGLSTSFWADKWVGDVKLSERFPRLFHLENIKDALVGNRGNWSDGIWVWNWDWIRSPRGRVMGELKELEEIITGISIDRNRKDRWKWKLDPKGEFSVKSLSKWIEWRRVRREAGITKLDRNTLVPKKVIVFIWRALNGKQMLMAFGGVWWLVYFYLEIARNMKVLKGKRENGTKLFQGHTVYRPSNGSAGGQEVELALEKWAFDGDL